MVAHNAEPFLSSFVYRYRHILSAGCQVFLACVRSIHNAGVKGLLPKIKYAPCGSWHLMLETGSWRCQEAGRRSHCLLLTHARMMPIFFLYYPEHAATVPGWSRAHECAPPGGHSMHGPCSYVQCPERGHGVEEIQAADFQLMPKQHHGMVRKPYLCTIPYCYRNHPQNG